MRTLLVSLVVTSVPSAAFAHGMDEGRLSIRQAGRSVRIEATPHSAAFAGLEGAERSERIDTFLRRFRVVDGSGAPGAVVFSDMGTTEHGVLVVRLRYRWATAPGAIRVTYDDAGIAPLDAVATRMTPDVPLAMQRPTGEVAYGRLSGATPTQTFFQAPEPQSRSRASFFILLIGISGLGLRALHARRRSYS